MKKGIGDKVLGWFIVDEDEEAAAAESPPEKATPQPVHARETRETREVVVPPGRAHDASSFTAVYRAAGVPDEDRERLAKVIGLVTSLPAEATPDVKRAIVGASLAAFGVPVDRIVATADAASGALDAYVVEGQQRTKEVLAQAEARIRKLEAEIEEVRRLMSLQHEAERELLRATAVERARIHIASEFFGVRERSPETTLTGNQEVPRLRRVQ